MDITVYKTIPSSEAHFNWFSVLAYLTGNESNKLWDDYTSRYKVTAMCWFRFEKYMIYDQVFGGAKPPQSPRQASFYISRIAEKTNCQTVPVIVPGNLRVIMEFCWLAYITLNTDVCQCLQGAAEKVPPERFLAIISQRRKIFKYNIIRLFCVFIHMQN